MTDYEFLDVAYIGKSQFHYTLPKKVRDHMEIKSTKKSLGYFLEANGDVSIGYGGENVIATSAFSPTFALILKKEIRNKLEVNLGDVLFFYKINKKVIISVKQL